MATTVAQVAPLLAGLAPAGAGNLRDLHPSDQVELWLDEAALVPLALSVSAAPTDERRAWAAARGYRDRPGQAVLELTLSRVTLNRPLEADTFPPPPAGARAEDAGFRDRPATADLGDRGLVPGWLPAGFRPSGPAGRRAPGPGAGPAPGGRPGPAVTVRTWTDGRAWVKVRSTRSWSGGRLFGDLGQLVRRAGLGAGVAYWSEDGTRVAVHAAAVDLVVMGSVGEADLARVAASLPVAGRPVPAGWAEAATSTLPEALAADPGLRRPPRPARVRAAGGAGRRTDGHPGLSRARVARLPAGPGPRRPADPAPGRRPGRRPRPRQRDGRWSPARGELEWVEAGRVLTLRSATLSLEELLAVAASLEPA